MAEENNGGAGNGAGAGAGAGEGAGKGATTVNEDGTVTIDGKTYISKESHEIVAGKYREAKSKLDKFDSEAAKAEEERLKKQGEFEKLAEAEKQKRESLEKSYSRERKVNALKLAAIQSGTIDPEAVATLANIESITVSEDGTIDASTVKTVVDSLKKEKPYLFGAQGNGAQPPKKPDVGNSGGGAPGGGEGGKTFYRSQLSDSKFYQENRKDILEAAREGRIVDDSKK